MIVKSGDGHKGRPLPPCAFCGKPTALIQSIGIAHELPTCKTYDELSPAHFLAACAEKFGQGTDEAAELHAALATLGKRGNDGN